MKGEHVSVVTTDDPWKNMTWTLVTCEGTGTCRQKLEKIVSSTWDREPLWGTDTHSNETRGSDKRNNSHAHEGWSCRDEVMTQVVWNSSMSIITSGRIIGAHASTIKTLLSSSRLSQQSGGESGLTFQEWTPDVDTSQAPVTMMINSSELSASGFKIKEVPQVLPPELEGAVRVLTRGVGLRSLEGMVLKGLFCQWMMTLNSGHVWCEWIIPFFYTEI